MTKEEFIEIMINELKSWEKFLNLYDELPWQNISESKINELVEFIEESESINL